MSLKSEFLSHPSRLWHLLRIFQSLLTHAHRSRPGLSIFLPFCGDRHCSCANVIPITYILVSDLPVCVQFASRYQGAWILHVMYVHRKEIRIQKQLYEKTSRSRGLSLVIKITYLETKSSLWMWAA